MYFSELFIEKSSSVWVINILWCFTFFVYLLLICFSFVLQNIIHIITPLFPCFHLI